MATAFNTMGATPSAPQIGPSSYASLQAAGMTPQSKALNLSMAGSPNTVKPISVGSGNITGSATPQGVSVQQPAPAATPHPATAGILSALKNTTGVLAGLPIGGSPTDTTVGKTPQEMAAANTTGTGTGSLDPTAGNSTTQTNQSSSSNPQYSSTNPPTFTGLVGDTANAGQGLIQRAQQDSPEVTAARNALQQSRTEESQALANIEGSPHTMNFAQGAENVIRNQYLSNQDALSNTLNSAVTTQGQQYTAQGTGGGLVGTAAGLATPANSNVTPPQGSVTTNTLTGQQYSNPVLAPIGSQQFYSPQPNGTPNQPATAGQAQPYTIKSGDTFYALAGGDQSKIDAIEAANPGVNPNNLQVGQQIKMPAPSQGTPFTAGVVSGQTDLGNQYAKNYSAYQQAEAIRTNIDSLIGQNPNLNPSQFTDVNTALQFLNGKVANPAYAILANNVAEYVNTLAPILGVGGDTTNYKTQLAQQFLQGASSGQSMSQIMSGIAQTAALKLQQQQSAGTNTGSVTTPTNNTSGGTGNDPLGIR